MGGNRWLRGALFGLVAVVAVFGLGACGGGSDEPDELTGVVKVKEDFLRFEPEEGTVELNEETFFTFQNTDDIEHNFTISSIFTDEPGGTALSVDVAPGQSKPVRFTVRERPRDGFITFYCRFHQAEGMHGRLTLK